MHRHKPPLRRRNRPCAAAPAPCAAATAPAHPQPPMRRLNRPAAPTRQVHLTLWGPTAVLVSWATCDTKLGPSVTPLPTAGAPSDVRYGVASDKLDMTATGAVTSYASNYTSVGYLMYASPRLHHTLLKGGFGAGAPEGVAGAGAACHPPLPPPRRLHLGRRRPLACWRRPALSPTTLHPISLDHV